MVKIKTETGEELEVEKYFKINDSISNKAQAIGYVNKLKEIFNIFFKYDTNEVSLNRGTYVKMTRADKINFVNEFESIKNGTEEQKNNFVSKWKCKSYISAKHKNYMLRSDLKHETTK
jgi:hypothetical protein